VQITTVSRKRNKRYDWGIPCSDAQCYVATGMCIICHTRCLSHTTCPETAQNKCAIVD